MTSRGRGARREGPQTPTQCKSMCQLMTVLPTDSLGKVLGMLTHLKCSNYANCSWKFNTAIGWFATHLHNTTEHCVSYFHCDNFMRHPDLRFGVALRCLMIDLGKFATVFARLGSRPLWINLNRKRWSLVTRMSGDVVTLWHVTLFRLLNCFLKEQLNIVKQHCCLHYEVHIS